MPRKDGTGPLGKEAVSSCGKGRMGQRGSMGSGPAGYCVCPKCGEKTAHAAGMPCTSDRKSVV